MGISKKRPKRKVSCEALVLHLIYTAQHLRQSLC